MKKLDNTDNHIVRWMYDGYLRDCSILRDEINEEVDYVSLEKEMYIR